MCQKWGSSQSLGISHQPAISNRPKDAPSVALVASVGTRAISNIRLEGSCHPVGMTEGGVDDGSGDSGGSVLSSGASSTRDGTYYIHSGLPEGLGMGGGVAAETH